MYRRQSWHKIFPLDDKLANQLVEQVISVDVSLNKIAVTLHAATIVSGGSSEVCPYIN